MYDQSGKPFVSFILLFCSSHQEFMTTQSFRRFLILLSDDFLYRDIRGGNLRRYRRGPGPLDI